MIRVFVQYDDVSLWCHCIATRASGSKCRNSTPVFDLSVDMAVCDSRVLLGRGGTNTLYVFDVSAAHILREAGSELLQSWFW